MTRSPRRYVAAVMGGALLMSGLSAFPAAPAWAEEESGALVLRSQALEVRASPQFPQVVSYTDRATGAVLQGNDQPLTEIEINGERVPVRVDGRKRGSSAAEYRLTPSAPKGVSMSVRLSVDKNTVTIQATRIDDPGKLVSSIRFPGQDLVTVSSREPGAGIAAANLSVDRAVSGDTFLPVTRATPLDPQPVSSNTILAHTGRLAAAFTTNSLYDSSRGPAQKDSGKFWRQAVAAGDAVEVGISSGPWLYRAEGSPTTEELPRVTVAITGDANRDRVVDWQDGAIAMRQIRKAPHKGEQTPDKVITHIPFNFASQATHPFLRTLDDVKRIALATDGLGQTAMLKGFTSEGHDSANTDYGDNFNERAGGLTDLNKAAAAAKNWNASFGVHLNATEIYPEANSFNEKIADKNARGWNWLDQSYYINQRYDRHSGELEKRIAQLAKATDDNLDFAYIDVYYEFGWLARSLQNMLVKHDFRVASEWSDKLSENNTWSHWANDEKYGGSANKGINSQILRFVNNTKADVWNPDPRLGTSHLVEFEGWTGQNDYNAFTRNVWEANLPTKFLQHHEIMRWSDAAIDFENGVRASGTTAQDRSITVHGAEVLRGGRYLLPWASKPGRPVDKLYHYNPDGGTTTWTLTKDFGRRGSLQMFRLGDGGRTKVATVPVVNGKVTVKAEAGQPYVLVWGHNERAGSDLPRQVDFGQGTPVRDPGFNETTLGAWNPRGDARVARDELGRRSAVLGAGPASISQRLGSLPPGQYTVSAWVGVERGATRPVTLSVDGLGRARAAKSIDSSAILNEMASDEWHGTTMQRLAVPITVSGRSARPTVTFAAGQGAARVRIDDVRVIASTSPALGGGVIAREDFEDVDAGWGPFIKADAGGTTDPRTHIAKRNAPYTQAGWNGRKIDNILNGRWSLMAHQENRGIVYRTSEYTVPFQAGHRYRVSFDHQSTAANEYAWVSGYDSSTGPRVTGRTGLGAVHSTTRFEQVIDASPCGDTFVGLERVGSGAADLILDDFVVEDLGKSEAVAACAQVGGALVEDVVRPGMPATFTTTFTSDEPARIKDLRVALDLPPGWSAEAVTPATADSVEPGASFKTTWRINAPATADGEFPIGITATYTTTAEPIGERTTSSTVTVRTLPPPPTGEVYASDHQWIAAKNGWGPVERDRSNGEQAEGDGAPLTLDGVRYDKGLGAHAPSLVRYYLGGQCATFTAKVGIDDKQTSGSVVFSVVADGKTVVSSPLMKGASPTFDLRADITGAQYVELLVGDGGDGNGNDHADWADAKFSCTG